MKTLKLSTSLTVPLNFVTEKHAWIGVTGSGKTYAAQLSAEQLWRARAPFVVLDPKGDWWGLRLAADGKGEGIPIPVFGGLHGDVPLEATAGAIIADLIFEKHISAVVDVSQFDTDADRTRFVTAFLDRLYFRHKRAPTARHLYLEECQEFIPQNPQPGEQRMLHVAQRVQKMGRGVGLGTSLLTQRPQEVSKKALNQAQTIFLFRLMGSQERRAIKDWVTDKGLNDELMKGLPELPTGTSHVWSPAWLKLFSTIKIARKDTFDASATPEVGAKSVVHELASIDLAGLKDAMAATIEKAKADDPKELRRQLAEARQQIATQVRRHGTHVAAAATPEALAHKFVEKVIEKRVEVPAPLKDSVLQKLESSQGRAAQHIRNLEALTATLVKASGEIAEALRWHLKLPILTPAQVAREFGRATAAPGRIITLPHVVVDPKMPPGRAEMRSTEPGGPSVVVVNIGDLGPAHRRVLDALAFLEGLGVREALRGQVGLMSKMSLAGGYGQRVVGELKTNGLVAYPSNGRLQLTDTGRARADAGAAPQTSAQVQDLVCDMVGPTHQKVLRALIASHPESVTRADIGAGVNVSLDGGYGQRVVGELKTLGAIEYPRVGYVRAADILFINERKKEGP